MQLESRKMDTERWTGLAHSLVLAGFKKNGLRQESDFRNGKLWGDALVSTLSALQLELGSGITCLCVLRASAASFSLWVSQLENMDVSMF